MAKLIVKKVMPMSVEKEPEPIPMLIICPVCKEQHVDEGEFAIKVHTTHACQSCGLLWKPALVPTVGVQFFPGCLNQVPEEETEAPVEGEKSNE